MTSRFHELFVGYAMHLSGDYEARIAALEHELKKVKTVIEELRIEANHNLEVDGSYNTVFVEGGIDSELILPQVFRSDELLDFDVVEYCEDCRGVYNNRIEHACPSESESE